MKSIRFVDFEVLIKEILMLDKNISLEKLNLFEIGLNSLQTMRIINRLKQMGIVISFAELMEKPYIEKWWEILSERMSLEDALSSKILISKESNSLTDVQYAYWIGRGEKQILGGVSCHAYFEFKGLGLDTDKLKEAWYKIQQRHPMLRARFLENGTQQIIEQNKFSNELIIYDLREKQSEIEEHLLKIRTTNSHRIFDIEKGHVAALEVTIINNKEYVIHFDIDLLVADLKSIGIVLNDLAALYGDKYLPKLPNNINFMNRVVNTNQSDYVKDREYWNQKMDDIPGMPELPICKKIIQIKKPVFKRRNFFLDENKWKYLLEICAFRQVTPAMVLLSLYAEVLGKFSNSSRFLINVPLFGRPLDEENIDFVVGDFTNILLLPIDISGKNQFTSIRNHRIEELDCIYGISLGASIAIEIALRDCIRINKLILDGGQFESMGIMKKIDAYFMAKEFQKVIQKKRMWSYVSKQMGYRNGNEIEVLYPLCCKRIQFDTLYDAALAAYGYDIKKRMEKLRMKVVIMYGGNELFAAKSVSLVKEKCVSECEVYAYDNMGHSEVLSLHPEKLCEIIRK